MTGHTGFKGAWLSSWLIDLGAEVTGLSLAPEDPSLFTDLSLAPELHDRQGDVRQLASVAAAFDAARPEVVFHLAAQALVRRAHTDPLGTFSTNVLGTAHVLDAVRSHDTVRAVVVVTSDKCYAPRPDGGPYGEDDALGGDEPYSASKAACEHVVAAYRRTHLGPRGVAIATARAGNVIGGGDRAADRLVPDAIRALESGRPVLVRNPSHLRPWQHVVEPLAGYLALGARLLAGAPVHGAWNFGPQRRDEVTVRALVELVIAAWGQGSWQALPDPGGPAETSTLRLRIDKAERELNWVPRWEVARAVGATVDWYRAQSRGGTAGELRALCRAQIAEYLASGRVAA